MDKIFVNGFIFKKPHPNAPDFIKGKVSIKMKDLIEFAKTHNRDGWLNIDLAESRDGKYYAALDTFVPDSSKASAPAPTNEPAPGTSNNDFNDEIPF